MKIEINLNDVFHDENGDPSETMEDAVRRQIIEKLTGESRERIFKRVDAEIGRVLTEQLESAISDKMPSIIDDLMNATYTPVGRYGERGAPTTFREQLIASITSNMTYAPKTFSHDENAFTKAVKSVVEAKTNEIRKAILEQVDANFRAEAIKFAVTELSKRLGLAK